MKKNIIFNIFIITIVYLFSFIFNVKAADYASCYYMHNTNEKIGDKYLFPIYQNDSGWDNYKNPNYNLIILIQYNSEKEGYTTPKIFAKLVDTNITLSTSKDFINAYNGNSGYKLPMGGNNPIYGFNKLPSINVEQIKNNDSSMMCPNVYLYGLETTNPANGTKHRSYTISLISEKDGFSEDYTYNKTLTPLDISSVSKGETTKTSAFNCSYNIKDYKSTIFNFSGIIGFDVDNDGNVSNIVADNMSSNLNLKYDGEKLKECPTYIKLKEVMNFTDGYTSITVGTADSYDGVYNGDISSGEDNKNLDVNVLATYRKYGENKTYITIEKSAGNYNVNLNGGGSGAININNLNDYMSDIQSGNVSNLPKFIIKVKDTSEYMFVNSLKNEEGVNIQAEEIYIEASALGINGTGLSDEETFETCRQLFGDDFLNFLNDYVFKIIWIGVPILLIVLTSFDFARVVFVDDKEGIQNAFNRLWKRAIAAVLVFLTPYIIILIANIVDPNQTTIQSCAKKIREMGNTSYIINSLTK